MLRAKISGLLGMLGFESRIARNSIVLGSAEILVRVLNAVISIILFRYLQPEGAGTLRFVISFGILFSVINEGGISRPAIRSIARAPQEKLGEFLGTLLIARTLLNLLMIAAIAATLESPLGRGIDPATQHLIYLWALSIIFQGFRRNSEIVFQALQQMHYHAAFLVLNRVVALAGQILVVLNHGSIGWVISAYVAADLLDASISLYVVRRRFARAVLPTSPQQLTGLFVEGLPFAVNLLCQQLRYYLDAVLLKYLYRGDSARVEAEIGLYSSATVLVTTFMFIPSSLVAAIFPEMARCYKSDIGRFRSLSRDSLSLLLFVGCGLSVTLYFIRADFLPLIFGHSYRDAVPMLAVAVWSLPFIFVTGGLAAVFAAGDRQAVYSLVSWIATMAKIGGAYFVLPSQGGRGAAAVMVAAEAFMLIMLVAALWGWEPNTVAYRRVVGIVAFHAAGAAILAAAQHSPIWRVAALTVYCVAVAAGTYWLLHKRQLQQ
jgi:O-antigen/teichoic acid export membrane protein